MLRQNQIGTSAMPNIRPMPRAKTCIWRRAACDVLAEMDRDYRVLFTSFSATVITAAVLSGLAVAFSYWVMSFVYPDRTSEVATVTVLTATFFGVHLVFLVGKMLGVTLDVAARRARLLYLAAVSSVVLLSFGVATLRGFFDFTVPAVWMLWATAPVLIVVVYVQRQLAERAGQKFENN